MTTITQEKIPHTKSNLKQLSLKLILVVANNNNIYYYLNVELFFTINT